MILCCDPPRHALLIHFGKQERERPLETHRAHVGPVEVEYLIDPAAIPPLLVAVHFPRHKYRLPFVGLDGLANGDFNLDFGKRGPVHHFYFSHNPRDLTAYEARPGLAVLVKPGTAVSAPAVSHIMKRPVLHGLLVGETSLVPDLDTSEMRFEFGADHLKDVGVSLFCRFPKPGQD